MLWQFDMKHEQSMMIKFHRSDVTEQIFKCDFRRKINIDMFVQYPFMNNDCYQARLSSDNTINFWEMTLWTAELGQVNWLDYIAYHGYN